MADLDQQQPMSRHDKKKQRQLKSDIKKQTKLLRHNTKAWLATYKTSAVAYQALVAGLVIVATVNFSLSYVGLYGYADTVMSLPWVLPSVAPIGVDGLTLCGIAATYLLRHARWRTRLFAWAVFLVPTLLSVAANVAHAKDIKTGLAGEIGFATVPLLLALATHALVVVYRSRDIAEHDSKKLEASRRHQERVSQVAPEPPQVATAVIEKEPAGEEKRDKSTATVTDIKAPRRDNSSYLYARQRATAGVSVSDIHTELEAQGVKLTRRSIERWTKDLRQAN